MMNPEYACVLVLVEPDHQNPPRRRRIEGKGPQSQLSRDPLCFGATIRRRQMTYVALDDRQTVERHDFLARIGASDAKHRSENLVALDDILHAVEKCASVERPL